MSLPPQIDQRALQQLIELARQEDLGAAGDITTRIVGAEGRGRARLVAREPCVAAGMALAPAILGAFGGGELALEGAVEDGGRVQAGELLGELAGSVGAMLSGERTLLNFLQRLCGVATLTATFVDAVAGTGAKVYDTRKTLPGWRALDKYAVRCGGGHNHRQGLYDAVLIKDNHLAGIPPERLAGAVFEMLNRASALPARPEFIEVEVDSLAQFEALLDVTGIDVVLLDNFTTAQMRAAVELRAARGLAGKLELEASGGVNLDRVRAIAETGVERISVGAITHSAPGVDIGLERIS